MIIIRYIFIVMLLFCFSCNKRNEIKKNEFQLNENKEVSENFFVFFKDFCSDSVFQEKRIIFPLPEIYLSEDLNDNIEAFIKKDDWEYSQLKKFNDNTFEYYFDSFTDREIKETDEKVYSVLGIENGININYFFKAIKGKWYLVKIENLTT